MPAERVITGVKATVAAILDIFEATQREAVFLSSPSFVSLAGTLNTFQSAHTFIDNGGMIRGITTISDANVDEARRRLSIDEDLRHADSLGEILMFVCDKQYSVSSVNIGTREYTLETPVIAFWSESPVYAEYLLTSFETAWSQAVPAMERIQELLTLG